MNLTIINYLILIRNLMCWTLKLLKLCSSQLSSETPKCWSGWSLRIYSWVPWWLSSSRCAYLSAQTTGGNSNQLASMLMVSFYKKKIQDDYFLKLDTNSKEFKKKILSKHKLWSKMLLCLFSNLTQYLEDNFKMPVIIWNIHHQAINIYCVYMLSDIIHLIFCLWKQNVATHFQKISMNLSHLYKFFL